MDKLSYFSIVFSAVAVLLVLKNCFAIAGCLGELDISSDMNRQDLGLRPGAVGPMCIVKELLDVGPDFIWKRSPAIEHAQQNPFDFQIGVDSFVHKLDGLQQFSKSTQCQEMRLKRDEDIIGGSEGIEGKQSERRGAVDKTIIEFILA